MTSKEKIKAREACTWRIPILKLRENLSPTLKISLHEIYIRPLHRSVQIHIYECLRRERGRAIQFLL